VPSHINAWLDCFPSALARYLPGTKFSAPTVEILSLNIPLAYLNRITPSARFAPYWNSQHKPHVKDRATLGTAVALVYSAVRVPSMETIAIPYRITELCEISCDVASNREATLFRPPEDSIMYRMLIKTAWYSDQGFQNTAHAVRYSFNERASGKANCSCGAPVCAPPVNVYMGWSDLCKGKPMTVPSEFRVETDSVGSMSLPSDVLFGIQTARAVENFPIAGVLLSHFPSLITALARVKHAAAQANADLGTLPHQKAAAIIEVFTEIAAGQHQEHFIVDVIQGGAGTSTNMNANEVIANLALQKLGHPIGA
jgi:lyase family enzyme